MMKKKLVIDARMLGNSGIGRYLHNLLQRLPLSELQPIFLTYPEAEKRFPVLGQFPKILTGATPYSPKQQLLLPLQIPSCELFWTPHFDLAILPIRAKKIFLSFHDTFHFDHPHLFSKMQLNYLKVIANRAVQRASTIMTPSEHAKSRILHFFPKAKGKMVIIRHGIDSSFISTEIQNPRKQFVFIGTIKPHKNLLFLLQAFQQFQKEVDIPHKLILFGSKKGLIHSENIEPLIQKLKKDAMQIEWIENASDALIQKTLSQSLALIFPSLYEGFGFPPLEAMAAGCATIVSNATSIPEVCQDNSLYFDPTDKQSLVEQMKALSFSDAKREELIEKGLQHVKNFCWEEATKQHLRIIETLLNG